MLNETTPPQAALATPHSSPLDELLALFALLPALVLAWPGPNPIAGDFATTELSGTGVALLAALPAACLIAWRRVRPVRGMLLLLFAWLAMAALSEGTDSLERDRTWMVFATGVVLCLAGGGLAALGRARVVRGLAAISGLLLLRALLQPGEGWGGVLGNSGELSAAALPGAFCALLLWARAEGKSRWLGLAILALFLVHAVLAPVVTSLIALAVVAALAALAGKNSEAGARPGARARLGIVCVAAIVAFGWVRYGPASSGDGPSDAPTTEAPAGPTAFGGVAVRKLIWASTFELIAEHPYTGVGAGQFAVAFPEFRDPEELLLSNWNHRIEANTEVEHPHSDFLLPFAEGGLAVGICWLGFLGVVLLAAWRALRNGCVTRAALGAASIGVLLSAMASGPLTFNAPASVAAFALFGALLSREGGGAPKFFGRLVAPSAAVVMLLLVPRAWSMWQMGLSLIETTETLSTTAQEISVDAALEHAPDSVVALSMKARLVEHNDSNLEGALSYWERVLALRPQRFEALMNSGQLLARTGRASLAQERFDAAQLYDPTHPGLLRNRVACAADLGLVDDALTEYDQLDAAGFGDRLWLRDLACDLILRGKDREGSPLLARADARFEELSGQEAWAFEAEYRRGGSHVASDAFKALAHVIWAREQALDELWDDSRRSYRQNLRITRDRVKPNGPTRVRMEMAAALYRSGMSIDAEEMLKGLQPQLMDWAAMPAWAGEALLEMGFGVERQ